MSICYFCCLFYHSVSRTLAVTNFIIEWSKHRQFICKIISKHYGFVLITKSIEMTHLQSNQPKSNEILIKYYFSKILCLSCVNGMLWYFKLNNDITAINLFLNKTSIIVTYRLPKHKIHWCLVQLYEKRQILSLLLKEIKNVDEYYFPFGKIFWEDVVDI